MSRVWSSRVRGRIGSRRCQWPGLCPEPDLIIPLEADHGGRRRHRRKRPLSGLEPVPAAEDLGRARGGIKIVAVAECGGHDQQAEVIWPWLKMNSARSSGTVSKSGSAFSPIVAARFAAPRGLGGAARATDVTARVPTSFTRTRPAGSWAMSPTTNSTPTGAAHIGLNMIPARVRHPRPQQASRAHHRGHAFIRDEG